MGGSVMGGRLVSKRSWVRFHVGTGDYMNICTFIKEKIQSKRKRWPLKIFLKQETAANTSLTWEKNLETFFVANRWDSQITKNRRKWVSFIVFFLIQWAAVFWWTTIITNWRTGCFPQQQKMTTTRPKLALRLSRFITFYFFFLLPQHASFLLTTFRTISHLNFS